MSRFRFTKNKLNSALKGLPNFLIFFLGTPNYTLLISHSPWPLASGGTWNVKIIASPLVMGDNVKTDLVAWKPYL